MAAGKEPRNRLETWKEVAAFFRKDERTVKRWEAERGLPVHRYPGGGRSRIFAVVAELEAWRDGSVVQAPEPEPEPPLARAIGPIGRRLLLTLGVSVTAACALLIAVAATRAVNRARPPPLNAQRDFVAASDDWAKRSPESLNRAIAEYNAAIALDPDYAEAYAGLARSYDLLREYTHVPASQAYPLARAAARRAIALDDRVASAHAALAFAEYWGFWNPLAARREFERAIALDPRSATAQHWYATFLSASGDQPAALDHIDTAFRLDPTSLAVASDRGLILILAGREKDGLAALAAMERAHPDFISARLYLADIYFDRGQFAAYLAEARRVATMTDDQETLKTLDAAQQALSSGGRAAFVRTLTAEDLERFRNGQLSAYSMATVYAQGGDQARALALLRLSLDRRESDLMGARANESFTALRTRPEFERILAQARPLDRG